MKKISIFELISEINPKLLEAEEVAARVTAKKRRKRRMKSGGIVLLILLALLLILPVMHLLSNQFAPQFDPLEFLGSALFDSTTALESTHEPETPFSSEASPESDGSDPNVTDSDTTDSDTTASETGESLSAFMLPVSGTLITHYEPDLQIYVPSMESYLAHFGIDVATADNAPVYAAADGAIESIWIDPYHGYCLSIIHAEGFTTVYKNLSSELPPGITEGASVTKGTVIATVGRTTFEEPTDTAHLHFEILLDDLYVDPLDHLDEAPWLNAESNTTASDEPVP